MYVRLVKYEPAKQAGNFSYQPAFFQMCRLKAGSRLPWKALLLTWLLESTWKVSRRTCLALLVIN